LGLALGALLWPGQAVAIRVIESPQVSLAWAPASGPVAVYGVWVRKSGESYPAEPALVTPGSTASLDGVPGETWIVRVAAYDAHGVRGPFSPESEEMFFSDSTPLAPISRGPAFEVPMDFDGNGRFDLAWYQHQSDTLSLWTLDQGLLTGLSVIPHGLGPGWGLHAAGDFDGDGRTDALLRDPGAGGNVVLLLDGTSLRGGGAPPSLDSRWRVAAAADLDGDGRCDLLWRDPTSGLDLVWLMNGYEVRQTRFTLAMPSGFGVAAAPDLDGDGRVEIVWRDGVTGENLAWSMNGATVSAQVPLQLVSPPFIVAGSGDYDGDGRSDLLWRDPGSGLVILWLMNGFNVRQTTMSFWASFDWAIGGSGDADGDGRDDVFFRNVATGENLIWRLDGSRVLGTLPVVPFSDFGWTLYGP
jgi:hypothetical protein